MRHKDDMLKSNWQHMKVTRIINDLNRRYVTVTSATWISRLAPCDSPFLQNMVTGTKDLRTQTRWLNPARCGHEYIM